MKGATWGASPLCSIGLQVSTTQECECVCFDNYSIKKIHALIKLVNAFFMSWEDKTSLRKFFFIHYIFFTLITPIRIGGRCKTSFLDYYIFGFFKLSSIGWARLALRSLTKVRKSATDLVNFFHNLFNLVRPPTFFTFIFLVGGFGEVVQLVRTTAIR